MSYSITAIIMNPTKQIDTMTTCWVERHGRLHQVNKAPRSQFTFAVSPHEEFFAERVPHEEQKRVRQLLAMVREINEAGTGRQNPEIKRLARSLQIPFHTLRRLYYSYTLGCEKARVRFEAGDWRTLLNWSKVKAERQNLPFAFLEFWRGLGEKNQRKWKPAWDELMQILRTGYDFKGRPVKTIPGFATAPEIDPVLGHPAGMSYENLMRHVSNDYDQRASRIGRAAASVVKLKVLKTRVHLAVGQFIEFDDHEFDQKVVFGKKPMRPLCFGAVDVLTDCIIQAGVKPTVWDEDAQVKRKQTEREALWFTLAVLCGIGYRRDKIGTTLVMERGLTTIRDPYLGRLKNVLGDYVKFYFGSNAGNNTRAAHAGQFSGQPKGNPRTKAIVESKWNAINNQTASLLGQVGKDRDNSPAQIYGAEKHTAGLIRQAEAAGVDASRLRLPFHSYAEWCQAAYAGIQRINEARDHHCEGWEKLHFVRKLWRTDESSPLWNSEADFARLSDLDQRIIHGRLTGPEADRLTKIERASRWEVFQAKRRELTRLPMLHIPEIVGPEFALRSERGGEQAIEVKAGLFTVQCAELDSDPISFYARDERAEAGHFIPNGRRFICFLNPYLPTHLIACDDQLRVVATCPRYERAHDEASLHRAMGDQGAFESAARVRLNLRHDDESRRKAANREHNDRLLVQGAGALPPAAPVPVADCTDDLLAREGQSADADKDSW